MLSRSIYRAAFSSEKEFLPRLENFCANSSLLSFSPKMDMCLLLYVVPGNWHVDELSYGFGKSLIQFPGKCSAPFRRDVVPGHKSRMQVLGGPRPGSLVSYYMRRRIDDDVHTPMYIHAPARIHLSSPGKEMGQT